MSKDRKSGMKLPIQAHPVDRSTSPGNVTNGQFGAGVEAAARCSQMKGLARQMCYASKGASV